MTKGERFIFVGGAPRSGTTLLQNILDSHPEIICGPQFRNIPDIIDLRKKLYNAIDTRHTYVFNSYEDIDNHVRTFIENLLMSLLERSKCKLLSEKTPENIVVFPELIELFPDAHFIYIIRDPRAVVLSFKAGNEKFRRKGMNYRYSSGSLSDFVGLTNYVKEFFVAGISSAKNAPNKILTVVYDKLVTDPESETKRICNYLGIEWSKEMLFPSKKKHLGEKQQTRDNGWYTLDNYYRDPDPVDINKWRKQITFLQKVLVSFYFRDIKELSDYGYDLSADSFAHKIVIKIFLYFKQLYSSIGVVRKFVKPILK